MEIQLAEVYNTLVRRYRGAISDDIHDAVAVAHATTWRAHDSGMVIRNVNAFATIVAKRALGRKLRRDKNLVRPDDDVVGGWEVVAGYNQALQTHSTISDEITAHHVITEAPEKYAEVMRLHYLEGHTLEEAAKIAGVTSQCMRKRHERALKWAREMFVED